MIQSDEHTHIWILAEYEGLIWARCDVDECAEELSDDEICRILNEYERRIGENV